MYVVGGRDADEGTNIDEILELVDGQWREVTTMQNAREFHAVTIIDVADFWPYCN